MPEIINEIHKHMQPGRVWAQRPVGNIKRIVVHHDTIPNDGKISDQQCLDIIYKTHTSKNPNRYRNWPGISYHFWISKEGKIYQLNNFTDYTYHDGINHDSLAVCLDGYYHPPYNESVANKQLEALKWILDVLSTQHPEFPANQKDVKGHRERAQTACPGNNLFPYVKEYREKLGNVDWGIILPQPTIITLDINRDIPSDVEEKLNLKSYSWYDKHWSMMDLIKYTDELARRN